MNKLFYILLFNISILFSQETNVLLSSEGYPLFNSSGGLITFDDTDYYSQSVDFGTNMSGSKILLDFNRPMAKITTSIKDEFSLNTGTIDTVYLDTTDYARIIIELTSKYWLTDNITITYTGSSITDIYNWELQTFTNASITNNVSQYIEQRIDGLGFWFRKDSSEINAGVVDTLHDFSNSYYDVTLYSNGDGDPDTINQGVRLDSTIESLESDNLLTSFNGMTIFMVFINNDATSEWGTGYVDALYKMGVTPLLWNYSINYGMIHTTKEPPYNSKGIDTTDVGSTKIHTHIWDHDNSAVRLNGVVVDENILTDNEVNIRNATLLLNSGDTTTNYIYKEIVGYNRVLTSAEIDSVETSLMNKYPEYAE